MPVAVPVPRLHHHAVRVVEPQLVLQRHRARVELRLRPPPNHPLRHRDQRRVRRQLHVPGVEVEHGRGVVEADGLGGLRRVREDRGDQRRAQLRADRLHPHTPKSDGGVGSGVRRGAANVVENSDAVLEHGARRGVDIIAAEVPHRRHGGGPPSSSDPRVGWGNSVAPKKPRRGLGGAQRSPQTHEPGLTGPADTHTYNELAPDAQRRPLAPHRTLPPPQIPLYENSSNFPHAVAFTQPAGQMLALRRAAPLLRRAPPPPRRLRLATLPPCVP